MQNLSILYGDDEGSSSSSILSSISNNNNNLTLDGKYDRLFEYNRYPFQDFFYWIYSAVVLLVIRYILNRCAFVPIAIWLGIKPSKFPKPPPNSLLEKTFHQSYGNVSDYQITGLVKQLDLTEREIQRWLRLRSKQNRTTLLSKFTESSWRFFYYTFQFAFGIFTLWDKPWFWNSDHFFTGYPNIHISSGEWWYYNIEASFYLSLLVSQFSDVKRKDFWVMFVHHVVTLTLISYSWIDNFVRIGTLVIVIHDFADIPLELLKLLMYLKKPRSANLVFTLFWFCWVTSRLVAFPYRVIYYSLYCPPAHSSTVQWYAFNGMLLTLQLLHLVWTYFIIRMTITALKNKELRDSRSEDEDD